MSELNISNILLEDLKKALQKNDPAASDPVTMCQYLAAVLGYVTADITAPADKLQNLLQQLNHFSEQVFNEEIKKKQNPVEPFAASFGIWRPK